MPHEKAIVITRFWANLYGALLCAFITGAIAYAWSANAQIAVLQRDVNEIKDAKLDVRLARMEEKLDWLVRSQTSETKRR